MAKPKPKSKPPSITQGRPPLAKPRTATLSARATRTLIRSHHNLLKARATALAADDSAKVAAIEAEIAARGGLESYQLASSLGQSASRGGDSSQVLVEWLKPLFEKTQRVHQTLAMLEVGALSTENACSKVPCLHVDRIDLHSQAPGIREIDFMLLPVPDVERDKYDIVSLSLVLNFVPDAIGRGEMLRRVPHFLRRQPSAKSNDRTSTSYLFLVLPLPCVTNSRYLIEETLLDIMQSLGFGKFQVRQTSKLYYSLWRYKGDGDMGRNFTKQEVNPGKIRNNFSIILQ